MEELSLNPKNPYDTLRKLVEAYLESLSLEKNASEHTRINYEIDLRHWLKFCFENGKGAYLERLQSLALLRDFLAEESKRYERSTLNRRLSAIKGFLKFAYREGVLAKNISKLIEIPKPDQKLPFVLKKESMAELLDSMPTDNLRQKRAKAFMELFYSTGIRVSELAGLRHENLDLRNGSLKVMGKGSKERVLPIGRHCQKAISDYITAMNPKAESISPGAPVFVNREGGPLSVRSVQRDLKRYALEVLGPEAVELTPHAFRHSCATHLLANGAGLREIQELLGHRSLVTTQKYTQVDTQRLKESYQKAHPKEKK